MMHYVITWATDDHKTSIPHALKHGFTPPPGVKILSNWHVVAQPRGYAIVEVEDAAILHALVIEWGEILDLCVEQVITDADAMKVLGKLKLADQAA